MPILTQDKAIKEYYEQVREQYPDVNFEQFSAVCKSPMAFFKECMRSKLMPIIMIKHIGKLRVFPSRIKKQLKKEEIFFTKGITDSTTYQERKEHLTNYLKQLNEIKDEETDDDSEG